jgi:hypothetical protein
MTDPHPAEAELVRYAFADSYSSHESVSRHLARCAECRRVVDLLRVEATTLRLATPATVDAVKGCLDQESIAALAEGSLDLAATPEAVTHLLSCPRCAREVASVARLLEAPEVGRELDRLGQRRSRRYGRRLVGGVVVGGAAAAAALLLMLGRAPSSPLPHTLYREESVTGTVAPRLVAPLGGRAAAPLDMFRWTSVPRADRYRITLFARDGSVIWEASTRDTAIAVPDLVHLVPTDTVLWRVAAHGGWEDRWATSELAMLTGIARRGGP